MPKNKQMKELYKTGETRIRSDLMRSMQACEILIIDRMLKTLKDGFRRRVYSVHVCADRMNPGDVYGISFVFMLEKPKNEGVKDVIE
jgi:hypothetical protein